LAVSVEPSLPTTLTNNASRFGLKLLLASRSAMATMRKLIVWGFWLYEVAACTGMVTAIAMSTTAAVLLNTKAPRNY
jgi:hypothetical protein